MAKVNKNKEGMIMKRVVITGMGVISPLGNDIDLLESTHERTIGNISH